MNKKTIIAIAVCFILASIASIINSFLTKQPLVIVCAAVTVIATVVFIVAACSNNKKNNK